MKLPPAPLLCLAALLSAPAPADIGNTAAARSPLAEIRQMIDEQRFETAIVELDEALAARPDDADLLNLVAYSHRRLGHYEIALNYYLAALAREPEHRGANEYLGELYLHTGQIEKAEERLAVLDEACFFGCREYRRLARAIGDYRRRYPD